MATKAELIKQIVLLTGQPKEDFKSFKAPELEDLLKDLEGGKTGLKRISIVNNKVTFEYYEADEELISFNEDRRDIVNEIIRNANNEININSKPEPNEELNANTRRSALARIARVAMNTNRITNDEARLLFSVKKTPTAKLYDHPAISEDILQSIANAYCEVNNMPRF